MKINVKNLKIDNYFSDSYQYRLIKAGYEELEITETTTGSEKQVKYGTDAKAKLYARVLGQALINTDYNGTDDEKKINRIIKNIVDKHFISTDSEYWIIRHDSNGFVRDILLSKELKEVYAEIEKSYELGRLTEFFN